MHPPLDRPHPDCQEEIRALKDCHADGWKKYFGRCNDLKLALDRCLKREKERLLDEMNKDLKEEKLRQEDMVKEAFGRQLTFQEYLQADRDYRAEVDKKTRQ